MLEMLLESASTIHFMYDYDFGLQSVQIKASCKTYDSTISQLEIWQAEITESSEET